MNVVKVGSSTITESIQIPGLDYESSPVCHTKVNEAGNKRFHYGCLRSHHLCIRSARRRNIGSNVSIS